jgi:hypothetical protein
MRDRAIAQSVKPRGSALWAQKKGPAEQPPADPVATHFHLAVVCHRKKMTSIVTCYRALLGLLGKNRNVARMFLSRGDCSVIGSRQPRVIKPRRVTLAQFSNGLLSDELQGRQECLGNAPDDLGPDFVGQKRFATDVVAAMSNLLKTTKGLRSCP